MEGKGEMVVTGVGINSQAGIIYSLMKDADSSDNKQKSVLQTKLADLALKIGYFGNLIKAVSKWN